MSNIQSAANFTFSSRFTTMNVLQTEMEIGIIQTGVGNGMLQTGVEIGMLQTGVGNDMEWRMVF